MRNKPARTPAAELVERILSGDRELDPVCSSPLQTATLALMSTTNSFWPHAHRDADSMVRLSTAAYEVAGIEGVRIPFDFCVEAEAFGCTVRMGSENTPPSVMKPAFGLFSQMSIPRDILNRGRIPAVTKAGRMLKEQYGGLLPVYTLAVAPLTLTGLLFGVEKVLVTLGTAEEKVASVIDEVADFVCKYAAHLAEASGGVIVLADPMASTNLLAPDQFRNIVTPTYQKIRRAVKGKVVLHICGGTERVLREIAQTGFEGFSFHSANLDLSTARKMLGEKVTLIGGVSTKTLKWGTIQRVRRECKAALDSGVSLLAPDCGFPVSTTLDKMKAMVHAVKRFKKH